MKIKKWLVALLFIVVMSPFPASSQDIFKWDFESGADGWVAEGGIWTVGRPTEGPYQCHSGDNCVGEVIKADHYDSNETRLVSPAVILPVVNPKSEVHLVYWQSFLLNNSAEGGAKAWLQLAAGDGSWQIIFGPFSGDNFDWTEADIDISAFQGMNVRFGFYLKYDGQVSDTFWHLDDIAIKEIRETSGYQKKLITENKRP